MRVRLPVPHPPLTSLEPAFAAIRAQAGVAEGYLPPVFFEAEHSGGDADAAHVVGTREDHTALPFVTLDPEGSRDLDQAVHIEQDGSGFRVFYAIADVGAHVVPGGALDADTRARVQTVYCPDRRIGLHPPVMSEGYASLLPGQKTKAVLWTLSIDDDGTLTETDVRRTWVRSTRQYAYDELSSSPPAEAAGFLPLLRAVGERRRALAVTRGAVTLPKPSQEVLLHDGKVSLEFHAASRIEDDNAQISLMTGEAAAALMLGGGVGVLRTMPPADLRAIRRLRHQARALGIAWRDTESYGSLIARLDPSTPAVAAFYVHATMLFRGAAWVPFDDSKPELVRPENVTHGALAVPYAHVTAPLRRLVDRYSTEICLAIAAGREIPSWAREALTWLGEEMARGSRLARSVDVACLNTIESALLASSVGEVFIGIGLDDRTVQLADPAVIARCHGGIDEGAEQQVRLVSVDPSSGPTFERVT